MNTELTRTKLKSFWDAWKHTTVTTASLIGCMLIIKSAVIESVKKVMDASGSTASLFESIAAIPSIQDNMHAMGEKITLTTDYAVAPIWEANPLGKCTYVNASLARLFGGHPTQFRALDWMQFVKLSEQEKTYDKWMRTVAQVVPYRDIIILRNGKTVDVQGKPYYGRDGKVIFWAGSATEVAADSQDALNSEEGNATSRLVANNKGENHE